MEIFHCISDCGERFTMLLLFGQTNEFFLEHSVPLWQAVKTFGSFIITGFCLNVANGSW